MRDPRLRVAAVLLPATLPLALSACSSDDESKEPRAERTSSTAADPTTEPPEDVDPAAAPKDATRKAFCAAYHDVALSTAAPEERVDVYRAGARKLAEVGTPADLTEYERRGFELYVTGLAGIDDEGAEELETTTGTDEYEAAFGISDDDAGLVIEFLAGAGVGCASELGASG